jgi:hypothetical protein
MKVTVTQKKIKIGRFAVAASTIAMFGTACLVFVFDFLINRRSRIFTDCLLMRSMMEVLFYFPSIISAAIISTFFFPPEVVFEPV